MIGMIPNTLFNLIFCVRPLAHPRAALPLLSCSRDGLALMSVGLVGSW